MVFTWSTEDPPLRAGYRIEWKFKVPEDEREAEMEMHEPGRADALPGHRPGGRSGAGRGSAARSICPRKPTDARRVVAQLVSTLERVGQVHNFSKGMGLAAPQINIGRAAAVIRTPDGETITLLNPRICDQSAETDEQYEGCLSFFEVRGRVPRPLAIEVEHQDTDGTVQITTFERGVWPGWSCHEVDHLFGILYRARMRPGIEPIPVSQVQGHRAAVDVPVTRTSLAIARIAELRFVVVGAYVADCFVNTARLPAWGQEYEARSIRTSPGGKALNQAVALARLGAQVTAVGAVGD